MNVSLNHPDDGAMAFLGVGRLQAQTDYLLEQRRRAFSSFWYSFQLLKFHMGLFVGNGVSSIIALSKPDEVIGLGYVARPPYRLNRIEGFIAVVFGSFNDD